MHDVAWAYPTTDGEHVFLAALSACEAPGAASVQAWLMHETPGVRHLSRTCAVASASSQPSNQRESAAQCSDGAQCSEEAPSGEVELRTITVAELRVGPARLAALPHWCDDAGAGAQGVSALLALATTAGRDATASGSTGTAGAALDCNESSGPSWCPCLPDDREFAALLSKDLAYVATRLARLPHRLGERSLVELVASIRMRSHTPFHPGAGQDGGVPVPAAGAVSRLSDTAAASLVDHLRVQMRQCLHAWETSSQFLTAQAALLEDLADSVDIDAPDVVEECARRWAEAVNTWSGGARTPRSLALLSEVSQRSVDALHQARTSGRYADALQGECVWVHVRPSMTMQHGWVFAREMVSVTGATMPLLRVPVAALAVLDAVVVICAAAQVNAPTMERAWLMRTYGELAEIDDMAAALVASKLPDSHETASA